MDLELRKKLVKCYIWILALYGAQALTLRALDQKHMECFEMWCWWRVEKIIWTGHVRNEEVLLAVKEQRNILNEISKWNANWIGHILRRNRLLRQVERKIKGVIGRRRKRSRKLLDNPNERRGILSSGGGGSSRSHYVENWLWKRPWTCRVADC
jgi:hypothetical protein